MSAEVQIQPLTVEAIREQEPKETSVSRRPRTSLHVMSSVCV